MEKIKGAVVKIELTKGNFALIDKDDFDRLSKFKWHFDGRYAARGFSSNGKVYKKYLHKEIVDYKMVDHINGNKLDNRKENLRPTNKSLNAANAKTSNGKYRGVSFAKDGKKKKRWKSRITVDGKSIALGIYLTRDEAAFAYRQAANKYFGEHVKL